MAPTWRLPAPDRYFPEDNTAAVIGIRPDIIPGIPPRAEPGRNRRRRSKRTLMPGSVSSALPTAVIRQVPEWLFSSPSRPDCLGGADTPAAPGPEGRDGMEHIVLGRPRDMAILRDLDAVWPDLTAASRAAWFHDRAIVLPLMLPTRSDVALLPGGAVVLRRPEGVLAPDPLSAVTFTGSAMHRLKAAVRHQIDAATLVHGADGIGWFGQMPPELPAQSVSVLADGHRVFGRTKAAGPALIQWCADGAVVWQFAAAPLTIALAATIAASGVGRNGGVAPGQLRHVAPGSMRADLITGAVISFIDKLLPDDISEDLRDVLIARCSEGTGNLVSCMNDAIAVLPACFLADPIARPGAPASGWQTGIGVLGCSPPGFVLLGLEDILDPCQTVDALRQLFPEPGVAVFLEKGDATNTTTAPLETDGALFLVRRAGRHGRLGVVLPCPTAPVDLYRLGSDLLGGVRAVTMAAPCWGFCHHVTSSGIEAGNATWFGMGPGLDELDLLIGAE